MRVGIVGSNGYIANHLNDSFSKLQDVDEIIMIGRTEKADLLLDLLKPEIFDYSALQGLDMIFYTAAMSGPDQCAQKYDECWGINVEGTSYFIRNAINCNCKVIFFSSDAVYGDNGDVTSTENSDLRGNTPYGKMKIEVEKTFSTEDMFKALRLPYVVSENDKFMSYCLSCLRQGKEAEIFHPFYRNCITITQLMNVSIWFLKNYDRYTPKSLNVAGDELVSRIRIADELNRIVNNRFKYVIDSPGEDFFTNRPRITQISSEYLYKYGILKRMSFSEAFYDEMKGIKYE